MFLSKKQPIGETINFCQHCDTETTDKIKKCSSCGDKVICRSCYYADKNFCPTCDDILMNQYSSMISKKSMCNFKYQDEGM